MLNLKVGLTKNPRFEPLIDGSVKSPRLSLEITVTTPPELFYRNLKSDEFDVFEMSISEYLMARERRAPEQWRWSALPVFPAKALVWLGLFARPAAGINGLADLRGKRVGVPDYVMTAALWFRVFLYELYDIAPQDISWYVGRTKEFSHGALLGFDKETPPGVSLTWLDETQTFDVMLDRGELDAAYGFAPRHDRKLQKYNIDRYGGTPIEGNPRFKKLFADAGRQVIREFHEKTRCVPANHTVAVQTRLLEENPWLAAELFELFSESKRLAYQANGRRSPGYLYFDGDDPVSQAEIFGDDPFPFGINKNRPMLDMLFRFSHQGGLTRKLAKAEEVFFPALLDT